MSFDRHSELIKAIWTLRQNQSPNPGLDNDSGVETPYCCTTLSCFLRTKHLPFAFAPPGTYMTSIHVIMHWRGHIHTHTRIHRKGKRETE